MFAIFEIYSYTDPDGKVKPIMAKLPPLRVMKIIENYLNENGFYDITPDVNHYDIFCKKNGFEVSFQLISDTPNTIVNISVFGKDRRGKTRKFLQNLVADLNPKLS